MFVAGRLFYGRNIQLPICHLSGNWASGAPPKLLPLHEWFLATVRTHVRAAQYVQKQGAQNSDAGSHDKQHVSTRAGNSPPVATDHKESSPSSCVILMPCYYYAVSI